jgi:spore maturation protein CgeB
VPAPTSGWELRTHCTSVRFGVRHDENDRAYYMPYEAVNPNEELGGVLRVPATTAAFAACRRGDFIQIGGFSDAYFYGMEDVDFALKVAKTLKKSVVVDTAVTVLHHRSYTRSSKAASLPAASAEVTSIVDARQDQNRYHFLSKARFALKREILGSLIEGERFYRTEPLRVVFVVTEVSYSTAAGDFFTAMELASELHRLFGWETLFVKNDVHQLDGADVVVVMRHDYSIERVSATNPGCLFVGWVRNRVDQWVAECRLDCFHILMASASKVQHELSKSWHGGVVPLPIATNVRRFMERRAGAERDIDVLFTGSFWGEGREAIDTLDALDKGWNFQIFGYGWEKHPSLARYWRGAVPYPDLDALYNRAKIVIDDAHPVTRRWNSLNSRVFDASAAGALVVTNNSGGAQELFDGALPSFADAGQLDELLTTLLSDEGARRSRAASLTSAVREKHSYTARAHDFRKALTAYCARTLRFAIKIGIPRASERTSWGDWHFAVALRNALMRAGHSARIDILPEWYRSASASDDVVVLLRGLSEYVPSPIHLNVVWLISHPDKVTPEELRKFDHVFVASTSFVDKLELADVRCSALLQCTDPTVFYRDVDPELEVPEVVFVGNSRGVRRRIIGDAIEAGIDFGVYGSGWSDIIPKRFVKGSFIDNAALRKYYSAAKVVLNDHWEDMRAQGFVSNRLFDAGACGTLIVSDPVAGAGELFGDRLLTYTDPADLAQVIRQALSRPPMPADQRTVDVIRTQHSFDARARVLADTVNRMIETFAW